jgi:hypothetical protein
MMDAPGNSPNDLDSAQGPVRIFLDGQEIQMVSHDVRELFLGGLNQTLFPADTHIVPMDMGPGTANSARRSAPDGPGTFLLHGVPVHGMKRGGLINIHPTLDQWMQMQE